jgi:hypothetical protein
VDKGFANAGIVGDEAHQNRPSYHNGKDVMVAHGRTTCAKDYTICNWRDIAGWSNYASALDLTRGSLSIAQFRAFGKWVAAEIDAGRMRDLAEFIYSPDGVTIRSWDGRKRVWHIGGDGTGWGDNSHLWHHHLGWFRDEHDDLIAAFAAYFGGVEVGLVINLDVTHDVNPYDALGTAKVKGTGKYITKVADGTKVPVGDGFDLDVVQKGTYGGVAIVALNYAGQLAVINLADTTFTPLPSPTIDCTAAVKAATDPLNAQLALLKGQVTDLTEDLAAAPAMEKERIAVAAGQQEASKIRAL